MSAGGTECEVANCRASCVHVLYLEQHRLSALVCMGSFKFRIQWSIKWYPAGKRCVVRTSLHMPV